MVKTKRMNMTQKYIEGDIVEYDNKIMVVKEPRDGSHFDLSCPKEGLVYCFVGVDEVRPVRIQGGRIKMRSPPKVLTGNFRPSQLSFFLS